MGMGLATTFVMTLASICAWLIDTWILIPLNLIYLRTLAFILVIAVVVQFTVDGCPQNQPCTLPPAGDLPSADHH